MEEESPLKARSEMNCEMMGNILEILESEKTLLILFLQRGERRFKVQLPQWRGIEGAKFPFRNLSFPDPKRQQGVR